MMIPGVDPRQLKAMMRQMGMSQTDIDATQVIIKTPDKTLVFNNPQVQKVVMQGQATFQVIGDYSEEEVKAQITISDDDINLVAEQSGRSKKEAKAMLEEVDGDIAEAIVKLKEE